MNYSHLMQGSSDTNGEQGEQSVDGNDDDDNNNNNNNNNVILHHRNTGNVHHDEGEEDGKGKGEGGHKSVHDTRATFAAADNKPTSTSSSPRVSPRVMTRGTVRLSPPYTLQQAEAETTENHSGTESNTERAMANSILRALDPVSGLGSEADKAVGNVKPMKKSPRTLEQERLRLVSQQRARLIQTRDLSPFLDGPSRDGSPPRQSQKVSLPVPTGPCRQGRGLSLGMSKALLAMRWRSSRTADCSPIAPNPTRAPSSLFPHLSLLLTPISPLPPNSFPIPLLTSREIAQFDQR
jgi:hypothetical protein